MDENLKKKILYIICAGIIVLFVIIAFLLFWRKPQKETVITRTEYLQQEPNPEKSATDLKAFLPQLASTGTGQPLTERTTSSTGSQTTPSEDTQTSSPPPTTTTTTTDSVAKAWSFFLQSIGLPFTFVGSVIPGVTQCGGANQPVCPNTPNNVTYITNETNVTTITLVQHMVDIPLSVLDSIQDVVFYKFIELLQQSTIANDHYPVQSTPEDTSWFTQLISTGEMSQFYYDVFKSTNPQASQCGTPQQVGFCYESNGHSANLYVRLRAATSQCPKGAIKTWNSDKNALQVTCF